MSSHTSATLPPQLLFRLATVGTPELTARKQRMVIPLDGAEYRLRTNVAMFFCNRIHGIWATRAVRRVARVLNLKDKRR